MAPPVSSKNIERTLRPLDTLEKHFFFLNKNRSVNFSIVAEVSGKRSVEQWHQGLNRLGEFHPMLSARVVERENEAPYFVAERSAFPLRHVEAADSGAWEQELATELITPFDTTRAPLARAVLLTEEAKSTLIFTIHHSIGDGYSVVYAVRDLLSILTDETPPAQGLREINTLDKLASLVGAPPPRVPPLPSPRPARYRDDDGARPAVEKLELAPAFTSLLLAKAREEKTTIHAALSVVLAMAGSASQSAWTEYGVRIVSPISIRKDLWQDERFELSLAPGLINVEVGSGTTFWESARRTDKLLAPQRTLAVVNAKLNGLGHLLGLGLSPAALGDASSRGMPYDLMISNLGKVPIKAEVGDMRIKKLWGPAYLAGWHDVHCVGITTIEGSLRLLYISHNPIPGLLEDAKARLEDAIDPITSGRTAAAEELIPNSSMG